MILSFSQINMYSRCGIQYYFRYVEGIIVPPASALILGKAFHKAQEEEYKHKLETKQDMPISIVTDLFAEEVERDFSQDVLLKDEEKTIGKTQVRDRIKDNGINMLTEYYYSVAVNTMPEAVEKEFTITEDFPLLMDSNTGLIVELPAPVKGYIDLITDKNEVIDTKTSSKTPTKDTAEKSQQLTIYALGYKEIYGTLPEKLRLDCIIQPGKKSPSRVVTLETTRNIEQIERLARRIARVAQGIKAGVFIPPDQGSWACSYCGYRDIEICKEYLI
jgi:CRISPR/Cas system-associated exonuclease Cas4 (RecB family)